MDKNTESKINNLLEKSFDILKKEPKVLEQMRKDLSRDRFGDTDGLKSMESDELIDEFMENIEWCVDEYEDSFNDKSAPSTLKSIRLELGDLYGYMA